MVPTYVVQSTDEKKIPAKLSKRCTEDTTHKCSVNARRKQGNPVVRLCGWARTTTPRSAAAMREAHQHTRANASLVGSMKRKRMV